MAHEARGMYALLVGPSEMYLCRDDMGAWISRRACSSSPVIPACRIIGLCATLERGFKRAPGELKRVPVLVQGPR